MYVGAVFTVALGVELVRGVAIGRRAWLAIRAAAAVVSVANMGDMRSGAAFLREQGLLTRTGLTALEIAEPVARPTSRREGSPATRTSWSPPAGTSRWHATSARRRRPSRSSPAPRRTSG